MMLWLMFMLLDKLRLRPLELFTLVQQVVLSVHTAAIVPIAH